MKAHPCLRIFQYFSILLEIVTFLFTFYKTETSEVFCEVTYN